MKYAPEIYQNDQINSCRFALGTKGRKPLIVIGINPSTADDINTDKTINRVMGFAEGNGFDSFIMLNLYPQRTPDPNELHKIADEALMIENLKHIKNYVSSIENPTILGAWSEKIVMRDYLKESLHNIIKTLETQKVHWIKLGDFTGSGHPRHPLYASYALPLTDFNPMAYLSKLKAIPEASVV